MRQIKEEDQAAQLTEFCFHLCRDKTKTSYPLHKTRKEMEEELIKCAHSQTAAVMGFYRNEILIGVCTFYWIVQEGCLQTTSLLFDSYCKEGAGLLFDYWKKELQSAFYYGFQVENKYRCYECRV